MPPGAKTSAKTSAKSDAKSGAKPRATKSESVGGVRQLQAPAVHAPLIDAPSFDAPSFDAPRFDTELAQRHALHTRATPSDRANAPERKREQVVVVFPDQLSLEIGPLAKSAPDKTRVLFFESGEWLSRRPYHRQRLAWILLSQRMFALECADRGFAVEVLRGTEPMVDLLRVWQAVHAKVTRMPLVAMEPAEREMRAEFQPHVRDGCLRFEPHDGFLTVALDLEAAKTREGFRMDRFYQGIRRRTGILMEGGKPIGGKYSFDAENRRRWDGKPTAPTPPTFPGSLIREEVEQTILQHFGDHPGTLDLDAIPATRAEIDRMWKWAQKSCLPHFGPFEDAMSRQSRGVFHTRLSPLMNLHRLLPKTVVDGALSLDLPIASKEGFVRQILGWREFVYQVHRATDGFRNGLSPEEAPLARPGDGGYSRWNGRAWKPLASPPDGVDGGARPNALRAENCVPPAYWGRESGLTCLDHVVGDVWAEGWSHHITRLMVLANIATLAGVSPRELCDWFWIAYIDAWDWVVEPNVLGMGTYGWTGMTTKPYVSGSAYLERMSDSCKTCAWTPGKDCPIGPMYWNFLVQQEAVLRDNPRMKLPLASARNRSSAQKSADNAVFVSVRDVLHEGRPLRVGGLFA